MTTPVFFETAALLRLLERAALFTGTDDTLPYLMCVRLDYDGAKTLTGWATDRYTAVRVTTTTVDFAEPGPSWSALLRREDIALISKAYRAGRSVLCEQLAVTRGEHRFTVKPADVEANGNWNRVTEVTVSAWTPLATHQPILVGDTPSPAGQVFYPDLPTLFDEQAAGRGKAAPTAVNPRLLARFAKAADRWTPMRINPAGNTAMQVLIGDDFTGLVMPVRVDRAGRERAA